MVGGAKEARVEEAEDEDENEAEEKDQDESAEIPRRPVSSTCHHLCLGPGRAEQGGRRLGRSGGCQHRNSSICSAKEALLFHTGVVW